MKIENFISRKIIFKSFLLLLSNKRPTQLDWIEKKIDSEGGTKFRSFLIMLNE